MSKRFFYDRGDMIRLLDVHTINVKGMGKRVVAIFEEKGPGPNGRIEMNRIYSPSEWVLAERELMEMGLPGVEEDLFDTEEEHKV